MGTFLHSDHEGALRSFVPFELDIHTPSEHTVDGKHYPIEIHIYHYYKGTDGYLGGAISIFFEIGEEKEKSNFFESIYRVYD